MPPTERQMISLDAMASGDTPQQLEESLRAYDATQPTTPSPPPPTSDVAPGVAPAMAAPPTVAPHKPPEPAKVAYEATEAPTFAPREISKAETVEGRMTRLTGGESPYIQQARQGAMETAQSRGLLNTTIAAGAGEREAIRAALPIATADAATAARAAESAQEAGQLAGVEGYRGEISSVLKEQEAGLQKGIAAQAGEIQGGLSAQEAGQRGALSEQEHRQRLELETKAQELTGDRGDQEVYVKLASGIQQEYQKLYAEIQGTADTIMDGTAKRVAIEALNRSTKSQMDMLGSLYEVDITWSTGLTSYAGGDVNPLEPPTVGGGAVGGDITAEYTGLEPGSNQADPTTGIRVSELDRYAGAYDSFNFDTTNYYPITQFEKTFNATNPYATLEYSDFASSPGVRAFIDKQDQDLRARYPDGYTHAGETTPITEVITEEVQKLYRYIMTMALNPSNPQVKTMTMPFLDKYLNYAGSPLLTSRDPAAGEVLPLWQQWTNQNI